MIGLSIQCTFGERAELMASDQECWVHQNPSLPCHPRAHKAEEKLDIERQNLSLLLKVFPGMSLHSIAEAYIRADGDPNYAAELLTLGNSRVPTTDVGQRTEGSPIQPHVFCEELKFVEASPKRLESSFHLEKTKRREEVKKQNGGSVVAHGAPGVHHHGGRPPEVNSRVPLETPESVFQSACQSRVPNDSSGECNGRNGINVASNSMARGNAVAAGNCASNGTGNTFSGGGSSLLSGWKGSSQSNKLSAISGTVSCHRQRRNGFPNYDAGKDGKDSSDGEQVFFYGKQKKKKKKGALSKNEDSTDASTKQRAAEEFLHDMLGDGFELGLDVVRDVLEHFSGDTDKALETLLNMVSTSPGFHVNDLSEQNEDPVEAANLPVQKELVPNNSLVSIDVTQQSSFDVSAPNRGTTLTRHMTHHMP